MGLKAVPVTPENFNRAESDVFFAATATRAGGLGKFDHYREVMVIDKQTVVRANRDAFYSVVDVDAGPVTATMPDAERCFMSLFAINED